MSEIPFVVQEYDSDDEWLETRRQFANSSEASIVTGSNDYAGWWTLNRKKRGLECKEPPGVLSDSELNWNRLREREILEYWLPKGCKHWIVSRGVRILPEPERAHPIGLASIPYACTPDAIAVMDGVPTLIEIKTASEYMRPYWQSGVPQNYRDQGCHQALVTGIRRVVFLASIGGREPQAFEVIYTDKEVEELDRKWMEFWRTVENNVDVIPCHRDAGAVDMTVGIVGGEITLPDHVSGDALDQLVVAQGEKKRWADEYTKNRDYLLALSLGHDIVRFADGRGYRVVQAPKGGKYVKVLEEVSTDDVGQQAVQ